MPLTRCLTPGISCEAVPASDPAGAACGARVGAAETFVSLIPLFDRSPHRVTSLWLLRP
jgi:hypothetical protein